MIRVDRGPEPVELARERARRVARAVLARAPRPRRRAAQGAFVGRAERVTDLVDEDFHPLLRDRGSAY